jgi:hypothetical protein
MVWLYSLDSAIRVGYSLGNYQDAKCPEIESLILLRGIRSKIDSMMLKNG